MQVIGLKYAYEIFIPLDSYINRKHPKFWLSKPIWALFSLMKKLSNLSYPKPSLMCYLFDMLIKPIMDYGSENGILL